MELEDIMLSEKARSRKTKAACLFYHMWKIDPKDKCIYKIKYIESMLIIVELLCETHGRNLMGGGKGK
jgi:hypothetical protein